LQWGQAIKLAKLVALVVGKKGVKIGVPFTEYETKFPVPNASVLHLCDQIPNLRVHNDLQIS